MRNKTILAVSILLVFALLLYIWHFSGTDVAIVSLEAPQELGIEELGTLNIILQNNGSEDVNVTINVKNSFVDNKGVSLKVGKILAYENMSYMLSNATDRSYKEVVLKPGSNSIMFMVGYQVPGMQKVEVEIYQKGKHVDSRTTGINVLLPKIGVSLSKNKGVNGTREIYSVFGDLEIMGRGSVQDAIVIISVIDEKTNTTVSQLTREYSFNAMERTIPLVVWSNRTSTHYPMTGMTTSIDMETIAPAVVIELSAGEASDEEYIMSPVVIKGKTGNRYNVIVTASWQDQEISSRVRIP